jgi:hypothetical protein
MATHLACRRLIVASVFIWWCLSSCATMSTSISPYSPVKPLLASVGEVGPMGQTGAEISARGVAPPFDAAVLVAELAGEMLPFRGSK